MAFSLVAGVVAQSRTIQRSLPSIDALAGIRSSAQRLPATGQISRLSGRRSRRTRLSPRARPRTARTYTYPMDFPGSVQGILPFDRPTPLLTAPPFLDVAPGMIYPDAGLYPSPGFYPPFLPIPSACSLRHNGTCHSYRYVMYGGCRDKRYTFEHCPGYQMCCYTEQTASPDPGTSSDPPVDPVTPADPAADCTYNGATYPSGDTFPDVDGCNTCQCTILGVMCTSNTC